MTGSARGRTGGSRYGEGVPLVAAAVCPHPPLIVPELAGAAAPELDDLRAAAAGAVTRLLAAGPDCVVVLGSGPTTGWIIPPAAGSLRPWGLDLTVPLVPALPDGGAALPLSLTVGAWLLHQHRVGVRVVGAQVSPEATAGELGGFVDQVHEYRPRVALLVMGDGSACRGRQAPGYDDPRAEAYDEGVAKALADADPDALLGLDPVLSAELKVAGWAPWQVLAGAVRAAGGAWRGELSYAAAPYGVSYFVANLAPA
ncbi:class III extradiol dioxygenase subunit B-like domain-containing protein [Micromonospora sp. IBHARD004]|uniref:class III extradiol dioxygenase subunit B-like domain-containing protein n=1 Tax=Micromonospora sp. IBHARD004 TaxID=3457764 RepID=UPI00405965DF